MKRSNPFALWPLLLCVSIFIAYILGPLFIHLPLALLGRFSKTSWRLSGRVFSFGVRCLLFAQPWLVIKRDFKLPKYNKPTILIANHRSNLDVYYFLSCVPNIRILAKKKFFRIPLFGIGLWLLKLIPVTTDNFDVYRKALKKVKNVLIKNHDPVLFFPEMTRRDQDLEGMAKFSLTPFQLAFETKASLVPVVLLGTDLAWPKGHFGGRFRRPTLIKSLPEIKSDSFESPRKLQKYVREQMQAALDEHWKEYYHDS